MKVTVVIVTYNAMQWIERCINSVLDSSIALEVIVIDNKSQDQTVDFMKKNF